MELSTFKRGLIYVLIASLLFGGVIFVNRILQGNAFNKEEAQHALYGLWLCKDIKALDFGSFWYDTQRQMYWPFFHSWILAFSFLVFGINFVTARVLSLVIFLATLILMYFVGSHIDEDRGWRIGLLAVFMALSSPFMIRFATENTLEGLGALIFLGSFALYVYCEERKLTIDYVLLAFLVGLSLYTNYLYAYLIIPAFIVMTLGKLAPIFVELTGLEMKGERAALPFFWWTYRKIIFLTVLFVLAASWFLTSNFSRKIMLFLQAIFKYSGGEMPTNLFQGLIYYPKAIIENYAFSPWLGFLIVLTLFLPFVALNNRILGKIYTFMWTVIILATLTISTKAPQFIYIIAPFLYLVFSSVLYYLLKRFRRAALGVLIIIFLPAVVSLPTLWEAYFPSRQPENMIQVLEYFKQGVPKGQSVAASVNLQHLNPEVISFYFADWSAPVFTDQVMGEGEMVQAGKYLLSIEFNPGLEESPEVLDDSSIRWSQYLAEKAKEGAIREHSQRSFNQLGLTARIYERVSQ